MRKGTTWLASLAVWTLLGVFNIAPPVVSRLSAGRPLPKVIVALIMESVWVWALYTPIILWLCRRLPPARWPQAVAAHAACAVALAFVDPIVDTPFVRMIVPAPEGYGRRLLDDAFINVFSYAAVAGVGYALDYRRRLADQRAREAELEAQLLRARLDALTARLRPHFLFNALHSVAALVRTGERAEAVTAVVRLGELLRGALRSDGGAEVSLASELAWVQSYLAIEQMRFQDRLCTELSADPALGAALVPALLLQPLVENAIRHGVEGRTGASRVAVAAWRDEGTLWLAVTDEGEPSPAAGEGGAARPTDGGGLGLRATRERLDHLFGTAHHFEVCVGAAGTRASIGIPFRTEEAS
jgi:two-component system, LytTR family, sensor kinase